ncbi:ninein-like protein isoform X2 [Oreochromis aureus]|uniref:EF-hand domain-containing protein n=1 Tax=Oreochromis aureus TaxID=47969 RepID=A0A668SGW6_OREAU|nr:ninein-like protein isoform X2 [Oreochromis aureus]
MEEAEHNRYVSQLKAEFDSCDTTATGFLDREELTALCRKLQLDAHLPLLLATLLGERRYGRVNFEEFKEGFVAVLSRSLDFGASEDDSSYLEPAVPEEVKPKLVKGAKRYGRRSKPDAAITCDSEDSPPFRAEASDSSPTGVRKAKLRRATSLESVESLKSDEEAGSQKETPLQCKGHNQGEEPGEHALTLVCEHLGLQHLHTEEVDVLLRKLDPDLDGRVSIREFKKVLCGSIPITCSTPVRQADLRAPHKPPAVSEERSARSASPSLLTATVGQRVLTRLDDGSGCTSPERVAALWTEEGIGNSRDILQTLDFPLEERLSLADLTLALDNELLVSGNGIHQAALISYKIEIQHLQEVAEQACRERDKVKADLERADRRNLQLVREVDDRHASMETLNQSRIRDLEQDFRDRLMALRSETEQESEALLQHVEREHGTLQEELQLLRAQEAELQEELCSAVQENGRLEEELNTVKMKLTEAEGSARRLQRDLDQMLNDKFGGLDPSSVGLSHEERFSEIIKEYEQQCRELRDRNDELSSELELLKNQRRNRKCRWCAGAANALSWNQQHSESDSDSDVKRCSSPQVRKKLEPSDKAALCSLDDSGPAISIQTELALEQLKQKHEEELQQLNIQLETQMNYYERSLEKMRQSMEVERKDISQAFKLEISELEEQKSQVEQQVKQLKETVDKLQTQIQQGGGRSNEQERRMQRERAELEQNFAREIGNLVQRLSAEKDQLEAELKLKMDQEVMLVREESEQQLAQMKVQHGEAQRRLLHQLHQERRRLQEQRGFWERRLVQAEQEKLCSEERAREEKRSMEEQQEEEVRLLKEEVSGLQDALRASSQSEASLKEELEASYRRSRELEARLEEACAQLEESIAFLESQELLNKRLASENSSAEEELLLARSREEELQVQVSHTKAKLEELQAASDCLLRDREEVAGNCSRLSCTVAQQQAQLRAREHMVSSLRAELENLQEALRSKAESVSRLAAELDSLKTDRARLIQDLKEQAMAVDHLQLQLDGVSEELDRRRSGEETLKEALKQEQSRTSQLRSSLVEEKEEVWRLSQENGTYIRLTDQLSTQIVEMEEEISSLRDHLRDLSAQLNDTADLVLELRKQLNAKTGEVEPASSEQLLQLQTALLDSENRQRTAEEDLEREKKKMTRQLLELEELVLALEELVEPAGARRTQLEEVQSENAALQERLGALQQEVHEMEDEVARKRRKLEEMEREHERSREEDERLHRENSRYREEVLDLSSRNLQLSTDNAELSARLHGDQESVRMLQERLATVSKEQEEEHATVRRLQDAALQHERQKLQLQASWTQEKQVLEAELSTSKEKLERQAVLEAEFSAVTLKLQWVEEDKAKLLRDADKRNTKVEKLQQSVLSLEAEAELLRSQLTAVSQEKLGHAQDATELQRKLQEAQSRVEELEAGVRKLMREKEELQQALQEQEEQASVTLQEETRKLSEEQQELKSRLSEAEEARIQAQDQAVRADAALSVAQAQHLRQLQEDDSCREWAELLQARLVEEQRRCLQLEEELKQQEQKSSSQISTKQDQYEKAMAALQQRAEDVETKLKAVRLLLQEKVEQLKEQLARNAKSSALLKDLYVENSQLMKALQVTEQRQKRAEKKNFLLEEKVGALNKLLRDIVPASLAT